MDEFKLPMISQETYDRVEAIVNEAKMCGSKKKVEEYVRQLRFLALRLPNRAEYKISEICSCLSEYCNIRANKYQAEMHLNNQLGGLRMMVEPND